ncbi:PKD domain-containing protein [Fulvivirgaceae bacterium BMA10]|uniref:PKD domain-containing protein n=1 Tax=Splendidivirga corallicola TaxID=3051826 RepID=A0ABT8L0I0_9BACT|nr:PKD domain-containing protein [Fulvivirgaceae bacterium BMA10]
MDWKNKYLVVFGLVVLLNVVKCYSQCPTADFSIPASVCRGEMLDINNLTSGTNSYEWNFCNDYFSNTPQTQQLSSTATYVNKFEMSLIEYDDKIVAFTPSSTSNIAHVVQVPSDNQISVSTLDLGTGNFGTGISIKQLGGNWYGLVTDYINDRLYRLNFGINPLSQPTVTEVTIPSDIRNLGAIEIFEEGSNIIAIFVSNTNRIYRANFSSDIDSDPTVDLLATVVTSGEFGGFKIQRKCDQWYGIVTSYVNSTLFKLSFGNSLLNSLTVTQLNIAGSGISTPYGVELVIEGKDIGFLKTSDGALHRIEFINGIENNDINTSAILNAGAIPVNSYPYKMMKGGAGWKGLTISTNDRNIYALDFTDLCGTSSQFSKEDVPSSINYVNSGTFNISLKAIDQSSGATHYVVKQITVTVDQAPDIDMSIADICVSNPINFTSENVSGNITSYSWNFGDTNTSSNENPSHTYSAAGDYEVRLDVQSSDGCSNSVSQMITVYPEPVPTFSIIEPVQCTNTQTTFQNNTPGDYGDAISWNWDFGDGTSSTDRDPIHIFTAGGSYDVELQASIPGCTTFFSTTVNVVAGPAVDFSAPEVCDGTEVQFTDETTGSNITGYTWDFGDGTNSTLQNPSHEYTDPGTYNVALTVDNSLGCSTTTTKTVTVHALPQVSFTNELACSGSTTQFFDQTVVANANITAWEWDFGDGGSSTEEDPQHAYSAGGSYTVKLITTSNFGCKDSVEIVVDVLTGPTADFGFNEVCLGEATIFEDLSTESGSNTITSWFWEINGETFTEQNPQYVFPSSGTYDVTLTITSSTFCTASITKSVEINPQAIADFSIVNPCVGDPVTFQDESLLPGDAILTYLWNFDDLGTSSESEPSFSFDQTGSYDVTLTITTENGCTAFVTKSIDILAKPTADFDVSSAQGAPPLMVTFTNNSSDATSYLWEFNDSQNTTATQVSPIFTFNEIGVYNVNLIATATNGCSDTTSRTINVVDPRMDLALEAIQMVRNGDRIQLVLELNNLGTLFINDIDIQIDLGGQLSISETFQGEIAPGQRINHLANFEILDRIRPGVDYVCANLNVIDNFFADVNITNNKKCVPLDDLVSIVEPFPNPVADEISMSLILPEPQKVKLVLFNSLGDLLLEKTFPDAQAGLNEFTLDMSLYRDGIYYLRTSYASNEQVFRIFVSK